MSSDNAAGVRVWPGVTSRSILASVAANNALYLSAQDLENLSDSMVVPWLNSAADRRVFEAMRSHPALAHDQGWIQGFPDSRWDFVASGHTRRYSTDHDQDGAWKVLMTRHVNAFHIADTIAFQRFVPNPESLPRGGVGSRDGESVLDESHPMLIYRYPSRNDDSRTMIAAALPRSGYLHNNGYVHAIRHAPGTSTSSLLALLGYLNTFTCDWWIRRFVDRHVNTRVINNIRLPDWTPAQITAVAQLSSTLLREGGQSTLAGSRRLLKPTFKTPLEARVELELLAAQGFSLGTSEMATVLSDFSEGAAACPASLREAILDAVND